MPFEIVIYRNPISQQVRRRQLLDEWASHVRSRVLQQRESGEEATVEPVMVTILHFHHDRQVDVDNIPKPILDALKGLIFEDDSQVTDLICRKRDLSHNPTVANGTGILSDALAQGRPFVYLLIESAPSQREIV